MNEAFEIYNKTAIDLDLPQAQKITASRRTKMKRRLEDCGGLEGWTIAMQKLGESDHCRGNNNRGWKADIDFVLQEKSFVKLMEDSYKSNGNRLNETDTATSIFDEIRSEL